jgi:hypothetical protein
LADTGAAMNARLILSCAWLALKVLLILLLMNAGATYFVYQNF